MNTLEVLVGGTSDPSGRRGRSLVTAADAGLLVRLGPGRYVYADAWRRATPRQRHLTRLRAIDARIAARLVVSHETAIAFLGLPWTGEFPEHVHVIDPTRTTSQTASALVKHPGVGRILRTRPSPTGRRVADAVTTAVDIAIHQSLRRSVPVCDVLLELGTDRSRLLEELDARGTGHGRARARTAIDFAVPGSGSAGESTARVALDEVGAPAAVLQHPFTDAAGQIGCVDFWYPEHGVVLEFDGAVKYRDPTMRAAGRTAGDVVVDEKRREDRIRRVPGVRAVGRFGWPEVQDAEALRAVLRGTGLPLGPRSFRTIR